MRHKTNINKAYNHEIMQGQTLKKKVLKAAREKGQITYKEKLVRLKANLSAEILQARRLGTYF